jgi:ankyrin repeat protein
MSDEVLVPLPFPPLFPHLFTSPVLRNSCIKPSLTTTTHNQGASPRELLLEACRRNNTSLLESLLHSLSTPEKIAQLLNTATDGVGEYCLHIAASYGSYEVLDTLLDQEGLEVDPLDRMERDTPLHKAVRFVNGLAKEEWEVGGSLVELLLDAGADPRLVDALVR